MKQYWSITEGVYNCLTDRTRTNAFRRAIRNSIRPDDVVVDLGAGSGILALFAAHAGARKVYAVESDPKNAMWLADVFHANGYGKIIHVIQEDARKVEFPEKADVVICEMIATGLIEELQVPVMNNALRTVADDVRVVLSSFESFIDVVSVNDRFYGFRLPVPQYAYPGEDSVRLSPLTRKHKYSTVDFTVKNRLAVQSTQRLASLNKKGMIANAVRICSRSHFCDGSSFGASFAYSYPIIIPIQPQHVLPGTQLEVTIKYTMSKGFENLSIKVAVLEKEVK